MSLISPTTVFVAGSMMVTLSPALLVWMIRVPPRLRDAAGDGAWVELAFATAAGLADVIGAGFPLTHAARICHSGSVCDAQCLPPLWKWSPPASVASGWMRSRLFSGT